MAGMSATPTSARRCASLVGGVGVSILAVYVTRQERHDVNAGRVESYSTLPVLLLTVALAMLLGALGTSNQRRTRLGLVALLS